LRLLSWLITIPLAALLVVFAIANRTIVDVSLAPLAGNASLPLFVIILATLLVGFLAGSLATWTSCMFRTILPKSRRLSRTEKELERLKDDLSKDALQPSPPKE